MLVTAFLISVWGCAEDRKNVGLDKEGTYVREKLCSCHLLWDEDTVL